MKPRLPVLMIIALALVALPAAVAAESEEHGAGETGETEEAGHGEGAGHGADQINWIDFGDPNTPPLVPMFFNFAVLLVILYFILRGPIGGGARSRRTRLEKEIEEARQVKEEAQRALDQARAQIDSIDQELAKLRQEIVDGGKSEARRITEEAAARAERMRSDTAALVEQEVARMSQAIREEVVAGIVDRAEAIIREKIRDDDQARLAREYLQSMSETAPGKPGS